MGWGLRIYSKHAGSHVHDVGKAEDADPQVGDRMDREPAGLGVASVEKVADAERDKSEH